MISRIWHGWTSPANADAYRRNEAAAPARLRHGGVGHHILCDFQNHVAGLQLRGDGGIPRAGRR